MLEVSVLERIGDEGKEAPPAHCFSRGSGLNLVSSVSKTETFRNYGVSLKWLGPKERKPTTHFLYSL